MRLVPTPIQRFFRTIKEDIVSLQDHPPLPPYQRHMPHALASAMGDRALEWFSALVMLGWGVVMAMPGDTTSSPAFTAFHRYGTGEEFWAAMFGAIGAARIVALYINGRWPRTPIVRMIGSLFGAVSWAQVCYMVTVASLENVGAFSTGTVVYGLLALAELFSIFRASFDARYYRS